MNASSPRPSRSVWSPGAFDPLFERHPEAPRSALEALAARIPVDQLIVLESLLESAIDTPPKDGTADRQDATRSAR